MLRSQVKHGWSLRRGVLQLFLCGLSGLAMAQGVAPATTERSLADWLGRIHAAPRQVNYVGTFVVSSSTGTMSSSRIWHAIDGGRQYERVESLSGVPRTTLRRNDEVLTLYPEQRFARIERRDSLGRFPDLLNAGEAAIADFYAVRHVGAERVAGFDADVVHLAPRDALRFGYRLWSERRTGLMVKLQTVGPQGEVLEQAAFSELQLDAPLRSERLAAALVPPDGWRVDRMETVKTTAAAEGWALKAEIAGFKSLNCYRRKSPLSGEQAMQWVFSDGLASVSLFVEPFDARRHGQEGLMAAGATHTLTRRVQDWWLTAVGEVPPQTLRAFAQSLERRK
jgi:sigma-E factor negative regulatory protein RseB